MNSRDHSFLDGTEWVLRTRVSHINPQGQPLTHDARITATAETRAHWNAQFWSLFPKDGPELQAAIERGDITVSVMFRFRPSTLLKERYGGHPVLKIARTAEAWRTRLRALPPEIAGAVEDYERDRRRLEEQRRKAWLELLHSRLPTAPFGYQWELFGGDARAYSDLLQFRLKAK
ncbi:MAG TPA: hypothetical protein VF021_02320 [Longimicrobiales bacterium]